MGGRTGRRANPENLCNCRSLALYKKKELVLGATPDSRYRHTREGCGPAQPEVRPGFTKSYSYHDIDGEQNGVRVEGFVVIEERTNDETGDIDDTDEAPEPCFFKKESDAAGRCAELNAALEVKP